MNDKKYKVRYHCYYTGEYRAAYIIYNLKCSVPKKTLLFFIMDLIMIIIKELAEEFKKQFTCLGENIEKHITFTVPIEKEFTRIVKKGEEIAKHLSYMIIFTDSARFMASSLSNLVNNLSEVNHRDDDKNYETCGIKYQYWNCFHEHINFTDDLIECKCVGCNNMYQQMFDEKLK